MRVAQEQYDRDSELAAQGAIARRELLASEAGLADAQRALVEAESQLEVLKCSHGGGAGPDPRPLNVARSPLSAQLTDLTKLGCSSLVPRLTPTAPSQSKRRLQAPLPIATSKPPPAAAPPPAGPPPPPPPPPPPSPPPSPPPLGAIVGRCGAVLMTSWTIARYWPPPNIFEKDLSQVSPGQRVRITVASLPRSKSLKGKLPRWGQWSMAKRGSYLVQAELDNAQGTLNPVCLRPWRCSPRALPRR